MHKAIVPRNLFDQQHKNHYGLNLSFCLLNSSLTQSLGEQPCLVSGKQSTLVPVILVYTDKFSLGVQFD